MEVQKTSDRQTAENDSLDREKETRPEGEDEKTTDVEDAREPASSVVQGTDESTAEAAEKAD